MSRAVIAEKPSVARDIAKVLGASNRGNGFFSGQGYVVSWAIGHLVQLAEPDQINPDWKAWRRNVLPMLPTEWPLLVDKGRSDQFEVVKRILTSPKIERVVCATDAGREGELIFRQIYEAAGSDKPVDRLWISSLTPAAIRDGFRELRPSREFDDLAHAARAPQSRGLARRDESDSGLHVGSPLPGLGAFRGVFGWTRADPDLGDARRARNRDSRVRAGRLPRGPSRIRCRRGPRLSRNVLQARARQAPVTPASRRQASIRNRRARESRAGGYRIGQ